MGQLQRLDASADPEEFQRLNRELMQLEMQRRALRPAPLGPVPEPLDFVSRAGVC